MPPGPPGSPPLVADASAPSPPVITLPHDDALRWPIITEEDERAVLRVLRSGELSVSDEVGALERDYEARFGVRHAVAHNNGTAAIHAALHAFDLAPGDEVIVPSATWWATVMPILHHGAVPVFAETETGCMGLDPEDVERRITPRTRAIVVVHLFGMPSKMDELLGLARARGLRVLEDASHAHGATYRGRAVGTLGDAAVFSMQANKLVPSAEGGMFLTDDDELREKVVRFGHCERLLPMKGSPNRRFAATGFGMKFRMSPLSAAVARVQLRHLDERNRQRSANCIRLSERLEALGIRTFLAPPDVRRVYFEFLVSVEGIAPPAAMPGLLHALQAQGARVEAPRYPLLHQQPVFTEGVWATIARVEPSVRDAHVYRPDDLPRTTAACQGLLRLPTFPRAGADLIEQYALAFEKVVDHGVERPRKGG